MKTITNFKQEPWDEPRRQEMMCFTGTLTCLLDPGMPHELLCVFGNYNPSSKNKNIWLILQRVEGVEHTQCQSFSFATDVATNYTACVVPLTTDGTVGLLQSFILRSTCFLLPLFQL